MKYHKWINPELWNIKKVDFTYSPFKLQSFNYSTLLIEIYNENDLSSYSGFTICYYDSKDLNK